MAVRAWTTAQDFIGTIRHDLQMIASEPVDEALNGKQVEDSQVDAKYHDCIERHWTLLCEYHKDDEGEGQEGGEVAEGPKDHSSGQPRYLGERASRPFLHGSSQGAGR